MSRQALSKQKTALEHKIFTMAGHVTYTDVLVVLRLADAPSAPASHPETPHGCTMRFLTPADVRAAAHDATLEMDQPYVEEALARGDRCFGVYDARGRLLSYSWYSTTATGVTQELTFEFPPTHLYMHHAFTHPQARGRRLHGASIRAAYAALAHEPYHGVLAIVSTANEASLRSCQRGGFAQLGRFYLAGGLNRLVAVTGRRCRRFGCNVTPRRDGFHFIALA